MKLNAAFQAHIAPHLARIFPFVRWWPRVNRVTLRADATAGAIGAIIVLPQGVAFATIAGMPPEYGLYAAIVPAIVAALFGSSWHLVSGPTTAISIVLYSTMSTLAEPGSPPYIQLVLMATFLTGVFQLAMGIARMGVLVNFISHTVVVGFTAGAGLLIAGTQIQHFFGIPMERGMSFVESIEAFITRFDTADLHVTAVGTVTLLVGIVVKRKYPTHPLHDHGPVRGFRVRRPAALSAGDRTHASDSDGDCAPGGAAPVLRAAVLSRVSSQDVLHRRRRDDARAHRSRVDRTRDRAAFRAAHRRQSGIHRTGALERGGQLLLGIHLERFVQPQRAELRSRRENAARGRIFLRSS